MKKINKLNEADIFIEYYRKIMYVVYYFFAFYLFSKCFNIIKGNVQV